MPSTYISDSTLIYNLTECSALSTTSANILWNYRNVGSHYRINTIRLVNLSAGVVNVSLNLFDYSTNSIVRLANNMPLSGKVTNTFSNVNTYFCLEEGDVLAANCSANNSINIIVQYDVFTDISQADLISRYTTQSNNGTIV